MSPKIRAVEGVKLRINITPDFFVGWGGKRHIKHVKKLFAKLKSDLEKLASADKDLNIDGVLAAIEAFCKDALDLEDDLEGVDKDGSVLGSRAAKYFKEFHDNMQSLLSKAGNAEVKVKLQGFVSKYNSFTAEIEKIAEDIVQRQRRENIQRNMLRDFDLTQYIAMYLQTKMRLKDLLHREHDVKSEDHKLWKMASSLFRKPTDQKIAAFVRDFEKEMVPAMGAVLRDILFLESMIIMFRDRLQGLENQEKQNVQKLLEDKFPEDQLQKVLQFEKLDGRTRSHMEIAYQRARAIDHDIAAANKLAA